MHSPTHRCRTVACHRNLSLPFPDPCLINVPRKYSPVRPPHYGAGLPICQAAMSQDFRQESYYRNGMPLRQQGKPLHTGQFALIAKSRCSLLERFIHDSHSASSRRSALSIVNGTISRANPKLCFAFHMTSLLNNKILPTTGCCPNNNDCRANPVSAIQLLK